MSFLYKICNTKKKNKTKDTGYGIFSFKIRDKKRDTKNSKKQEKEYIPRFMFCLVLCFPCIRCDHKKILFFFALFVM